MTQSMYIIYICWKIQLLSANQIAASRKEKSKKCYTTRTKQVLPSLTAAMAKGQRERWYCVRRPAEARCPGYLHLQNMSPATMNCFTRQRAVRMCWPLNLCDSSNGSRGFSCSLCNIHQHCIWSCNTAAIMRLNF